jgi:hypothetical protein
MMQKEDMANGDIRAASGSSRVARVSGWLLPLFIIVIAVLLFFNRMAFSNLILARGDTFLYFYPYWQAAADAITSGRLPLWNDQLFMGAPFLANSQAGVFYPLNWPFWLVLPTPYAVSGSIILHVIIAGWGAYLAGRFCLTLSKTAAFLSAVLFALGGYLTAQIEHVNQLQGLAWLPWYFVTACWWRQSARDLRANIRFIAVIAVLVSLQLLAGHTQTVFISVIGLLVWLISSSFEDGVWRKRRTAVGLMMIFSGAILAILVSGIQVAPTAELLMNSSRQGGISPKEALSFSLHPLLVSRSLLPQYELSFFTEYIAYLPLTALLLAIAGAWNWRQNRQIRSVFIVAAVGFLFALGMFNPIYQLLVRIPGFDLFRVPARWLALYAFGTALLAGAGLEKVLSPWRQKGTKKALVAGILAIIVLLGWGLLSGYLASFVAVGSEVTVEYPGLLSWMGWGIELILAALIFLFLLKKNNRLAHVALITLVLVVLFSQSRSLPYNELTTPEAFSDLRPPITRLQAISECLASDPDCDRPAGRILSLSDLFFDPGDQGEIDSIYSDLLPESARYDYTIAIKQKEILAPDLSMLYGLQSVDGFDGGVLPLANYTELMDLILPENKAAVDGRLREYLDSIPEARWMDLFNAKYLITDKVGDEWRGGVFFDRQHQVVLDSDSPTISPGFLPEFLSTELWLISSAGKGLIDITFVNGAQERLYPERIAEDLYRVKWSRPSTAKSLTLLACESAHNEPSQCEGQWYIEAATLVDDQEGVFMPITLGDLKLIHSGDVKIYENLDVFPRAFLVNQWTEQQDTGSSIDAMADPLFDPEKSAVVVSLADGSTPNQGSGVAEVLKYEQESVDVSVTSESGGLLILTDAYYPGWRATIDGEQSTIYQTDGYFRGVVVPPGEHLVEYRFEPGSLRFGVVMTAFGIIFLLILLVVGFVKRKVRVAETARQFD